MPMNTSPGPNADSSPCNDQCALGTGDICTGCYRTVAEINTWEALPTHEKQQILADLPNRRTAAGG